MPKPMIKILGVFKLYVKLDIKVILFRYDHFNCACKCVGTCLFRVTATTMGTWWELRIPLSVSVFAQE